MIIKVFKPSDPDATEIKVQPKKSSKETITLPYTKVWRKLFATYDSPILYVVGEIKEGTFFIRGIVEDS